MSSNRVRPPNSGATRNEDKPDPCDVKLKQGNKGTTMKIATICAISGVGLQLIARIILFFIHTLQRSFMFAGSPEAAAEAFAKYQEKMLFYATLCGISELTWIAGVVLLLYFFIAFYINLTKNAHEV